MMRSRDKHLIVLDNHHSFLAIEIGIRHSLAERSRSPNHRYSQSAVDACDHRSRARTPLHFLSTTSFPKTNEIEAEEPTETIFHLHSIERMAEKPLGLADGILARQTQIGTVAHQRFGEQARIVAVHEITAGTVGDS